jgi:D-amino-acid dehydrogenase
MVPSGRAARFLAGALHDGNGMKVLVLGAGVVGVTSAYYLARAGHDVTVIERREQAGLETSFANAGQVSPGYSAPWAAPGIPVKALKWLLMKHRPLVIWPMLDPAMWRWGVSMLANCTDAAYARNKARMVRLAEYSRDSLRDLRHETGIAYDDRQQGTLQLFRTQKQLDHISADTDVLDQYQVPYEVLNAAGCVAAEPALAPVSNTLAGGLRLPHDETGDAHQFTQRLAKIAEGLGVVFRYGTTINTRGQRDHRRRDRGGSVQGRSVCAGAGQLLAAAAAAARHSPAGLSGEGLLDHRADHRPRCGTRLYGYGRDLQGGDHAPRRPHPRRRHGGAGRL